LQKWRTRMSEPNRSSYWSGAGMYLQHSTDLYYYTMYYINQEDLITVFCHANNNHEGILKFYEGSNFFISRDLRQVGCIIREIGNPIVLTVNFFYILICSLWMHKLFTCLHLQRLNNRLFLILIKCRVT
jgi:hypothetical protein